MVAHRDHAWIRVWQVGSALLLIATLVIAIVDGIPVPGALRLVCGAICALLVASLTLSIKYMNEHFSPDRSLGKPKSSESPKIDIEEILEVIKQTNRKYDDATLGFFLDFLLFPSLYTTRAVEEARIDDGVLNLHVAVTIDRGSITTAHGEAESEPKGGMLVVPLVRVKKGALLDNFDIEDSNGKELPSLSQREAKTLIAYSLISLYWKAYIGHDYGDPFSVDEIHRNILEVVISSVYKAGKVDPDDIALIRNTLKKLIKPKDRDFAEVFLDAFLFFTEHYVVAAEIPCQDAQRLLVLKYNKSLPPLEQHSTSRDRWRLRIGLRPYRFNIPLWWPFVASSYHFRMNSHKGHYVADHYLINVTPHGIESVRQDSFISETDPTARPYLRIRHHRGFPYAHFYARELNSVDPSNLSTVVEFSETPPGTLGAAAGVALVNLALICVATFSYRVGASAVNISTLLLAAPAFAASAVGITSDGESLLRSSLTTRIGLLTSGVLSLVSVMVYLIQGKGSLAGPVVNLSLFGGIIHLVQLNAWWLGLWFLAIISSLRLVVTLIVRTRRYTTAVRHKGNFDNPYPTKV